MKNFKNHLAEEELNKECKILTELTVNDMLMIRGGGKIGDDGHDLL
ncbi:MAG: hypothetical protein JXB24_02890 [Bacteroidales bacterium]|nr:hypothetical protein [Bacteroidales bacterium]